MPGMVARARMSIMKHPLIRPLAGSETAGPGPIRPVAEHTTGRAVPAAQTMSRCRPWRTHQATAQNRRLPIAEPANGLMAVTKRAGRDQLRQPGAPGTHR